MSYDHEDAAKAAPIAAVLEKAGHNVWWDRRIDAGAEYNNEIEGAVERADAVLVLWSERSIRSAWVRDEAAEGPRPGQAGAGHHRRREATNGLSPVSNNRLIKAKTHRRTAAGR